MGEIPHPAAGEFDQASDAEAQERVRREEDEGARYSKSEVSQHIAELTEQRLRAGEAGGERTEEQEALAKKISAAFADAVANDRKKELQEELPRDATFFFLEQQLRSDAKLESIAADSADEKNLIAMLGVCHEIGTEIRDGQAQLSSADDATFDQASRLLGEVEVQHQSSLRVFRQHLLEGNLEEAAKDYHFYFQNILGRALEVVTVQERELERLRFTLKKHRSGGTP